LKQDQQISSRLSTRLAVRIWKIIYMPIFGRAARQILRGRQLERGNPRKGRWLESDVQIFLSKTWNEADLLMPLAEFDELPTVGARHNVFLAVLTTAAYRVMAEEVEDPDDARSLVADIGWKIYRWMLKLYSSPFKILYKDPGKRMEKVLRALMVFPFHTSGKPGYEADVWTEGDKTYTYWTHCPPQSFVRRVVEAKGDHGELDAFYNSWCRYDWAGADLIADDGKHGHYTREHTLSRGDSVCDMCWYGKPVEKETEND